EGLPPEPVGAEAPSAHTPRLDRDEVGEMIAEVLLHGAPDAKPVGDLRIDLVPRPPDLPLDIAAQRREILVERFGVSAKLVQAAHAFLRGQVLERLLTALAGVARLDARTLHDHARHILTHGRSPSFAALRPRPAPARPETSSGAKHQWIGLAVAS